MATKTAWRIATTFAAVLSGALAFGQTQQYQVFSWDNFEEPTVSPRVRLGHKANPENVRTFPLQDPKAPAGLFGLGVFEICGLRCLSLTPSKQKSLLSIVASASLDRAKLGAEGRALYQYDLFLPAEGRLFPGTALLAISSADYEKDSNSTIMYRFGVNEGGTRTYFSYMNGPDTPKIYKQQGLKELNLKRPGWHRFQFIFHGQDEITLAIDGKPTSFSPLKEASIKRMTPGVMAVAPAKSTDAGAAYLDNLSIQWSPTEAPIPESPWPDSEAILAGASNSLLEPNASLAWFTVPDEAWRKASQEHKPLLVLFYMPRVRPYMQLIETVPSTPEVRDLLAKYVLLRIDANQLQGGTLAQRFRVPQVPTFLTLGPDGKETSRLTVIAGATTWPQIEAQLKKVP